MSFDKVGVLSGKQEKVFVAKKISHECTNEELKNYSCIRGKKYKPQIHE